MGKGDTAARQPRGKVIALGMLIGISALSIDILLPAIPALAEYFRIGEHAAQYVVTTYLAGFALGQLPMGLLADRFGRRPVIAAGVSVFIITALIGAFASTASVLFTARFVQGFAGAVGPVVARAIARDLGGPDKGARLLATLVAILGLAPLLAPLLGGAITELAGWRATLLAIPCYGLITLVAIWILVPESLPPHTRQPRLGTQQVIDSLRALSAHPASRVAVAVACVPYGGYLAMITSASTVLIEDYHLSPATFGAVFALGAAAYTAGAATSRQLMNTRPAHWVLALGIGLFVTSAVLMALIMILGPAPLWALWGTVAVFIFAVSLTTPIATSLALAPLPGSAGFTAALIGAGSMAAGTLGSWLAATFYAPYGLSMLGVMIGSSGATVLAYTVGRATLMQAHEGTAAP
ncbi:MAG: Bcr/CflA family efflux MFS transporter [Pseudomonadota bacterium]